MWPTSRWPNATKLKAMDTRKRTATGTEVVEINGSTSLQILLHQDAGESTASTLDCGASFTDASADRVPRANVRTPYGRG
ncbi:hypothetical protein CELD12_23290 [Cellulomonas sp. NTE-D12]|nr:hypothetical protein CELD12_23290 [Cellulomonas sp. NTE-D12]